MHQNVSKIRGQRIQLAKLGIKAEKQGMLHCIDMERASRWQSKLIRYTFRSHCVITLKCLVLKRKYDYKISLLQLFAMAYYSYNCTHL